MKISGFTVFFLYFERHFHSLGLTDGFTPPRRADPLVLANRTGVGRSHGGFQDFGYLDPFRPQTPYQLSEAQSGHLCPTALLQGHQVMVATDNLTVVSYISKQGGTCSPALLHLTVDLFLWLEAQNIIVRARHIPGCLNVIADQQGFRQDFVRGYAREGKLPGVLGGVPKARKKIKF